MSNHTQDKLIDELLKGCKVLSLFVLNSLIIFNSKVMTTGA